MFHIIIKQSSLKRNKGAKKLAAVEKIFTAKGLSYEVHKTVEKTEPKELAQKITSDKGNTVVVMGGDGTLHEVLNGFSDFENNSLALIPFGTGNDFAESAKIPLNVKKAATLIAENEPKKIDFIEFGSGLRSINAVGMGIDVDVLKTAYSGKNNKKSKYLRSLILCLIRFKSYKYTVKYDGKEEKHCGLIGAVGNGRQIGGGIRIFPEAKVDDGYLDLLVVDFISRFKTIGAFIKLMLGRINSIKQVTAVRTKAVEFIAEENDYTVQADGELYDNMPLSVKISETKLSFYMR